MLSLNAISAVLYTVKIFYQVQFNYIINSLASKYRRMIVEIKHVLHDIWIYLMKTGQMINYISLDYFSSKPV